MIRRTVLAFISAAIFMVAADRAPAPIQEIEETPAPTPLPAKPKTKSISDVTSKSSHQFDGTWTGSGSFANVPERQLTGKYTLVISEGKRAVGIAEISVMPTPQSPWTDLPSPQNLGPVSYKVTWRSREFKVSGSDLTIRWSAPEISDLAPKEMPQNVRAQLIKTITEALTVKNASIYTLKGDELTREKDPSTVKVNYRRVR